MESNDSILPAEPQTPSKRGAHYTGDRPIREKLDQLYNKQKLSSGEIARQYSVTRKTVTNWLKMEGFDRRTGTEAAMLHFATQAEFVPSAEREDCVLDRAWEARPERRIRDKVSCRLCFRQVSRLTGKSAHLSTGHKGMTGDEYARLMPEHRHNCFQHAADSNGLEVEKLMDDWCTEWATADEIRNWRLHPKPAQAKEYVGCLECGRKLFGGAEIQRHLRKVHNWSLERYRERYPGAPTGSLDRRRMQAQKSNKRWDELKHLRGLAKPKGQLGRKKGRGETLENRINLAAAFQKLEWNQRQMSEFVYSDTKQSAYANTRNLFADNRTEITDRSGNLTIAEANDLIQGAGAHRKP
jgi:DNA-binding transcriptional regulator YiaG